jgi:hypothetical protein
MLNPEELMPPWLFAAELTKFRPRGTVVIQILELEGLKQPKAANERSDGALVGRDLTELP